MDPEQARDVLGVKADASNNKIEDRYRELVQKNHPDQGGSAALFKQIKQAYEVLTAEDSSDRSSNTTPNDPGSTTSSTTYSLSTISDIELDKLVQDAMGRLVTKNRLTKRKPGISHLHTLTDSPLIEYIHRGEQPHYSLRFTAATFNGDTVTPKNGGFLLLSNTGIRVIVGYEEGDEIFDIPPSRVTSVDSSDPLLSNHHKIILETNDREFRLRITHNPLNESQISDKDELDTEIKEAEQFIRELAYQTMN